MIVSKSKIRTFKFSVLCLLFLQVSVRGQEKSKFPSSPNVIIFIADDVSWKDFGCYGNTFVQTPNIDKLAANGMKFNNAILTASSCSPSRISIMTGRYPHNTGAAELHTEPKVDFESIASRLKENGYYTGQAGKWHMGSLLKKGFDKIYEKLEENGDGGENRWIPSLKERDKNKPFFFWFASYDAHRIWGENHFAKSHEPQSIDVPPTLVDDYSTRVDLAQYYDEIKRFDYHIGQVVNQLKEQDVFKNTLIIVMADNGRPFPRDKTRMYDSGMKTPFIVHWPEKIKKGSSSNSLISSLDIAPTILDVCRVGSPESFQGNSFKKVLSNPNMAIRKYAFSEHNWHDHEAHERMARTKDYIYVLNSRPQFPNQGPADALNSLSFKALQNAQEENTLTPVQADVFLFPRPDEELFAVKDDPMQLNNQINNKDYASIQLELKNVLLRWMEETGDTVPEHLTKDWYTRDTGGKIESNFEIRGEMPGESRKADKLNNKVRF
ncbi:MAG: sulfatase [Flavobacteriaceae bacterium]